jgi:pimeloyl-ACP methyl ester carboxylesterase
MVALEAPVTTAPIRCEPLLARDGVALALERHGAAHSPALVFAHGFGQTRHAWSLSAAALAGEGWQCITADARGHGESGWRADGVYEFEQFVDDLLDVARSAVPAQLGLARSAAPVKPILIGASMGGLLGLIAQAEHEVFRALVLVDVTPRWELAGVERILAFMRAHPDGFASVDEAVAAIAHYLPHRAERYRNEQPASERLRKMLVPRDDGRLRWHWDPRLLERIAADAQNQQQHLIDAARRIRVPTLLISGEHSDIVSNSTIAEFQHCVPHAQHVRVARATHMIVGDRNDAFTDAVRAFIQPLRPTAAAH